MKRETDRHGLVDWATTPIPPPRQTQSTRGFVTSVALATIGVLAVLLLIVLVAIHLIYIGPLAWYVWLLLIAIGVIGGLWVWSWRR